jgi:hypothetical protein
MRTDPRFTSWFKALAPTTRQLEQLSAAQVVRTKTERSSLSRICDVKTIVVIL